ncbi:hypothetical protein L0Y59_03020, partial [Candidatus Uhrbacteria bacterium]|nr:hypothetical protein [Candidatus Uhrbacteria bacterium]
MTFRRLSSTLLVLVAFTFFATLARADNTAQTLPFSQNWTNTGLITANDNWSGVSGIEGFRGDGLTGGTGTDPQTLLASDTPGVLDVNANQTNPSTFTTGGATEFHLANPVVGLTGSGTADAPYLKFYLNTTGQSGITISYVVSDLDASTDNAVQQVALQFRVGNSGNFTNVPAGYIADATTGPSLATLVTPVCAVLPAAADNQALVEVRIMTTNAVGNDEYIGIDDIVINTAGCAPPPPDLTVTDVSQAETNAGTTTFTFQVNLSAAAGPGGVTFDIATADGTAQDDNPVTEDNDYVAQSLTGQNIAMGSSTYNFDVTVNGDVLPELDENFFVNVTGVTGANVTDGQGEGTIQNDDASCASLSIDDVTQVETDAGTTTFAFTVSLSQAGCGTVTFDIGTQDNTATDADNDYDTQSLTGQTITFPSTYTFNVTVNGDTTQEPDQTFFVNITNVSPANVQVADGQGLGTILNDDYTRIHDIQGPGGSSPLSGSVTTRGIVTGRKSNGFFLQEPDASVDADPMTSEGIFVFTSSAPPVAAAVGNSVEVTATIAEFIPSSDPLQPPLTELTSPTVVQLSTGNPLPAPIPLTSTFPDPAGPFDQLERLEGMRVSIASLTTSAPTLGNSVSEPNATQTSNGVFFGTITGVPRPAREPGIQDPDPAPSGGTIPPIPRFDANPELIRVDSDGLTGAPILDVNTGATVTGLVGPLDYGFRHYTVLPDPTLPAPVVTGGMSATSATGPTGSEFTVASYNVERFFDTVNDPAIGEPVLTATAYDNRLNKVSLGIRNNMQMP